MSDPDFLPPAVFISHATTDAEIARALQTELERVFGDAMSVFCASSPGAIGSGQEWLKRIEAQLASAQAVIVILTPLSIERHWIWFELGAAWDRSRTGSCHIYPLRIAAVDQAEIPAPLDRLQVHVLNRADDLKVFFKSLAQDLGIEPAVTLRPANVTKRIPPYHKIKIDLVDQQGRGFYSGKYDNYPDEDLAELIDAYLLHPDHEQWQEFGILHTGREDFIFNGKLLQFREIDQSLQLPPGTARRLLVGVAERYGLTPKQLTDNLVRFHRKPDKPDGD